MRSASVTAARHFMECESLAAAIEIGLLGLGQQRTRVEPGEFCTSAGGRIRNSVWRNQNQLDYPTISTRIWKKSAKRALAISIAWQPFPNASSPSQLAARIRLD
jgi:hypothetical protein